MRTLFQDVIHMRIIRKWARHFTSLELQGSTDILLLETGDALLGEMS